MLLRLNKFLIKLIKENWLLILILILGAFLRLYRIGDYMTFLGDEGRDALIVRNLLVKFDPILIGPGTSVGGMYLGPLYYYFMAPFLLLSNFNPVGPAIAVAVLGVITIYLVYKITNEWFNKKAAIISSLFYAISPTVIIYSHSSWNPNIMPFFALLSIYSIWKVWNKKQYIWLLVTSISTAFVLNSHYLGILLLPVIFIYWIKSRVPLKYTFKSILIFLFLMSPVVIFDFRHNFMNLNALLRFFAAGNDNIGISFYTLVSDFFNNYNKIVTNLVSYNNPQIGVYASILLLAFNIFVLTTKKYRINQPLTIILLWFAFGLFGFSIYRHPVYDHYYGFLYPVPFLMLGYFIKNRYDINNRPLNIIISLFLLVLFIINIINTPILKEPNRLMQRSMNVSKKVIELANTNTFNLAVLAERNYEDGYRYFLEVYGANVLHADRWDKNTISETLMIICEMPKEKCDPTHSAKAEVANFGWSKIDSEFEIDGVTIYKLIHTK